MVGKDGLAGIESMSLARRLIMFKESGKPVLTKGGENRIEGPQVAHCIGLGHWLNYLAGAGGRWARTGNLVATCHCHPFNWDGVEAVRASIRCLLIALTENSILMA